MKVCFSKTFTMGLKACFDVGLNVSSPKHVPRMGVLTFGPRWDFTDYCFRSAACDGLQRSK